MKNFYLKLVIIFAIVVLIGNYSVNSNGEKTIKIGEYASVGVIENAPMLWRCVDITSYGALMVADENLCNAAFDMGNADDLCVQRKNNGSNLWQNSDVHNFLNSNDATSDYGVFKKGFLTNFSNNEKNAMAHINEIQILNDIDKNIATKGTKTFNFTRYADVKQNSFNDVFQNNIADSVFLLDVKQVENVISNYNILGDTFLTKSGNFWLRTPVAYEMYPDFVTVFDGNYGMEVACDVSTAVRPAFYLKNGAVLVGNGDKNIPYIIGDESANMAKLQAIYENNVLKITVDMSNCTSKHSNLSIITFNKNGEVKDVKNIEVINQISNFNVADLGDLSGGAINIYLWENYENIKPIADLCRLQIR